MAAKTIFAPKPIRTEAQYQAAVARMDELLAAPDAEASEELDLITILVMAYEAEQVPDVPLDPVAYLEASMDNRGLTQADLARLLGSSSRAAEVLGGKRELSKAMIRALVEAWGLDANTLIGAKRAA
ncbi:transcriptional regulator [Xanthobacter sp. KR7-225]|uniref:helix-turn-helix domain-containing protein n=1 Tax=Xanthobacter sp. KR7-225 TaxID=3156613 RepID=UPI0032B4C72D